MMSQTKTFKSIYLIAIHPFTLGAFKKGGLIHFLISFFQFVGVSRHFSNFLIEELNILANTF